jgi:branched-chain amino acid transport system ATP-binding protein
MENHQMILQVEDLEKSFSGFKAIGGVSFTITKGEICSIIGPNGAGKSTLFDLITGHQSADKGRVFFDGTDISRMRAYKICRLGLGRSFQRINIFPKLTVFENIQTVILVQKGKSLSFFDLVRNQFREETEEILEKVDLQEYRNDLGGSMSYGYQKQLELGIALASDPKMLLLDEPTAGMSARETNATIELIVKIVKGEGLTLLFTEHDMSMVFSISERILILHQGKLIAAGLPEEVRENREVRNIYFGETK